MKPHETVTINGQFYDAHTGLPITGPVAQTLPSSPSRDARPSSAVHASTQKSHILHRKSTPKPSVGASTKHHVSSPRTPIRRSMDIARHPGITKFAPTPVTSTSAVATRPAHDIQPVHHPGIKKYSETHSNPQPNKPVHKPAQQIKQEAIAEALAQPAPEHHRPGFFKRHRRVISITIGTFAMIGIGAYLAFISLPNISVSIASAQAGISASYPQYVPGGYRLNGPVRFDNGHVTMAFHASSGTAEYTISQISSSWDSSAVLKMVEDESDGQFITTQDRGLTVYTYNGNAAWVNGGILYTITGNAPLSSEVLVRIATSL